MPIIDHFSKKIRRISHFHSFHNAWATEMAYDLNRLLPQGFLAEPNVQIGRLAEIDERADQLLNESQAPYVTTYRPPAPAEKIAVEFPQDTEVYIVNVGHARTTVGVIEIVSSSNKDRPESREIFISKCVGLLSQGISLVVVDIVTARHFNFHNAIIERVRRREHDRKNTRESTLYCSAYRYVSDLRDPMLEFWWYGLAIGEMMPDVPLYIISEIAVPVKLEQTYVATCKGLRVPV